MWKLGNLISNLQEVVRNVIVVAEKRFFFLRTDQGKSREANVHSFVSVTSGSYHHQILSASSPKNLRKPVMRISMLTSVDTVSSLSLLINLLTTNIRNVRRLFVDIRASMTGLIRH